jgi:hypothetical protein
LCCKMFISVPVDIFKAIMFWCVSTLVRGHAIKLVRPYELFVHKLIAMEGLNTRVAVGLIEGNGKTSKVLTPPRS